MNNPLPFYMLMLQWPSWHEILPLHTILKLFDIALIMFVIINQYPFFITG